MARYTGPVCKLCRREGEKLFLKGERCFSPKCSVERRGYPPGQHGRQSQWRRSRQSDFGAQLRAKQKARRVYGVLERQFRRYYKTALKSRGLTGFTLLQLLESRLDNVIYRMGFATSRAEARQLVRHGHFLVNGRKATIPSMLVKPGNKITLREKSREIARIVGALEALEGKAVPQWLEIEKESFEGTVKAMPTREDITLPIEEQLIVELYSR